MNIFKLWSLFCPVAAHQCRTICHEGSIDIHQDPCLGGRAGNRISYTSEWEMVRPLLVILGDLYSQLTCTYNVTGSGNLETSYSIMCMSVCRSQMTSKSIVPRERATMTLVKRTWKPRIQHLSNMCLKMPAPIRVRMDLIMTTSNPIVNPRTRTVDTSI